VCRVPGAPLGSFQEQPLLGGSKQADLGPHSGFHLEAPPPPPAVKSGPLLNPSPPHTPAWRPPPAAGTRRRCPHTPGGRRRARQSGASAWSGGTRRCSQRTRSGGKEAGRRVRHGGAQGCAWQQENPPNRHAQEPPCPWLQHRKGGHCSYGDGATAQTRARRRSLGRVPSLPRGPTQGVRSSPAQPLPRPFSSAPSLPVAPLLSRPPRSRTMALSAASLHSRTSQGVLFSCALVFIMWRPFWAGEGGAGEGATRSVPPGLGARPAPHDAAGARRPGAPRPSASSGAPAGWRRAGERQGRPGAQARARSKGLTVRV
jgi:hypothetical protein